MRKIIQILLFVISYVPLYFILFFQNINDKLWDKNTGIFIGLKESIAHNRVSLVFLVLIIASIVLYFILYKIVIQSAHEEFTVKKIQDNHSEYLSYLATYILPFIGLKFDSWQNIFSTLALFSILGHIYIKTNLILANPTLAFFRFHISRIQDENERTIIMIHKLKISEEQKQNAVCIINNIYLQKVVA